MRYKDYLLLLVLALPAYADVNWACSQQGLIPFQENGKWGYLTSAGVVIPPKFDEAGTFNEGHALVCISGKCGYIDTNGIVQSALIDPKQVNLPQTWTQGPSPATRDGIWGYVDQSGHTIIPFKFKYAGNFEEGLAKVVLGDKYFFINVRGERVTPEFDGVFEFSEGLAAVQVSHKIGYIKRDGTFSLPPLFQSASGISFSEGLVAVRIKGKVGFMDQPVK